MGKVSDSIHLQCYCYTKVLKVQSFNIDQWGSDKQQNCRLLTVQSQAQDFKFPLIIFYVQT